MKRNNTSCAVRKGFTIVELLIYGGILAMFLIVLSTLFSTLVEDQLESQTTTALSQDGRFIVSRLSFDIARATDISTPSALGVSSPTLSIVIGGVTNTYSIVNGNLLLSNNNGTDQLNSVGTSVSSASFTRLGTPSKKNAVRTLMTLTSTTVRTQGAETEQIVSTVALR